MRKEAETVAQYLTASKVRYHPPIMGASRGIGAMARKLVKLARTRSNIESELELISEAGDRIYEMMEKVAASHLRLIGAECNYVRTSPNGRLLTAEFTDAKGKKYELRLTLTGRPKK